MLRSRQETIRDDRSRGQCDDNDGVGCRDSKGGDVYFFVVELGDCWCHSLREISEEQIIWVYTG